MYQVEQAEPTEEFKQAWSAAGRHIQNQVDTGFNWLRANLNPPMAEHLSFRIGNQIFFVFVEAAEFNYKANSNNTSRVSSSLSCPLTKRPFGTDVKCTRSGEPT